jgi:hypothetical protein
MKGCNLLIKVVSGEDVMSRLSLASAVWSIFGESNEERRFKSQEILSGKNGKLGLSPTTKFCL